jgi:hypothetical protein
MSLPHAWLSPYCDRFCGVPFALGERVWPWSPPEYRLGFPRTPSLFSRLLEDLTFYQVVLALQLADDLGPDAA